METNNQFKKWFYNLTVEENRKAKREILKRYEIPASTFYYWMGENFNFNRIKKDALNQFAHEFNGSVIFEK